jgi:hypothetical protein
MKTPAFFVRTRAVRPLLKFYNRNLAVLLIIKISAGHKNKTPEQLFLVPLILFLSHVHGNGFRDDNTFWGEDDFVSGTEVEARQKCCHAA